MHRRSRSPTSPVSFVSSSGLSETDNDPLDLRKYTHTNTRVGIVTLCNASRDAECVAVGEYSQSVSTSRQTSSLGNRSLRNLVGGKHNNAFGYEALANLVDSDDCTAMGYFSSRDTDASGNSSYGSFSLMMNHLGTENDAYGAYTLSNCVNPVHCAAFGYMCLNSLITGEENSGYGQYCMAMPGAYSGSSGFGFETLMHTTVGGNTAMGAKSMRNSQTGFGCVAFGFETLMTAINPQKTSVFGYRAGYSASGMDNTLVGFEAMGAEYTNGFENSALGSRALRVCKGSRNTAVGCSTLSSLTTGHDNAGCGAWCLVNAQESSQVVALGSHAGENIVNSTGHTMAGYYSGPATDGFNNSICLGAFARSKFEGELVIGAETHPVRTLAPDTKVDLSRPRGFLRLTINGKDVAIPMYDFTSL